MGALPRCVDIDALDADANKAALWEASELRELIHGGEHYRGCCTRLCGQDERVDPG